MKKIYFLLAAALTLLCVACNKDNLKGTQWTRNINYTVKVNDNDRPYTYNNVMNLDGKTTGTISEELIWVGGAADSTDSIMKLDTVTLTYDYDADSKTGTVNWQGAIWHFTVSDKILLLQDKAAYYQNDTVPVPFNKK